MQKKITVSRAELLDSARRKSETPLGDVCALIRCLSEQFQEKPQLYEPQCREELWAAFPRAVLQTEDFFEDYGAVLASLSDVYPVTVHGFADRLEEGELSVTPVPNRLVEGKLSAEPIPCCDVCDVPDVRKETGRIQCVKQSMSGRDFELLSSVWLKIRFRRRLETDFTAQVIRASAPGAAAAAVCARWADVFSEKDLFADTETSRFRYVFFDDVSDQSRAMIGCLSVSQIKELWVTYLADRSDSVELELFYERLNELSEEEVGRLTMALRLALDELSIRVGWCCGEFHVTDAEGARLWFDFASKSPAEKLFLKLLFPVARAAAGKQG